MIINTPYNNYLLFNIVFSDQRILSLHSVVTRHYCHYCSYYNDSNPSLLSYSLSTLLEIGLVVSAGLLSAQIVESRFLPENLTNELNLKQKYNGTINYGSK